MSGASVTEKHRELAKMVLMFRTKAEREGTIAQIIADAEARGREAGIREAAREARQFMGSNTIKDYILALLEVTK